MISNNNELDFEKIINKISFPRNLEDYRTSYKYDAKVEDIESFETELKSALGIKSYSQIQEIILKNQKIFSPEVYLFHVGKLVEKDYNDAKEAEILHKEFIPKVYSTAKTLKPAKTSVEYFIEMFSNGLDVVDISINTQNKELTIESSQELYGNKRIISERGKNNRKKILNIETILGLQYVISFLNNKDLLTICRYPNLGGFLATESFENNETRTNKFIEILMKYAEYMDIDKLLVIANYNFYNKYGANFEKFSEEEFEKLNRFTDGVEGLLDDCFTAFSICSTNEMIGFQSIKLSIKTLKNCFIDGRFHTISELNEIAHQMILGEIPIETLSKDTFKKAFSFTYDELQELILNNPNTINYLLENDYLSLNDFEKAFTCNTSISNENLMKLIEYGILNEEKLLDYYLNNKINIDSLLFLKNTLTDKVINKVVSNRKFIELFLDKSRKYEFSKYVEIYKTIRIDGKTNEEKDQLVQDLIGNNIEQLSDDDIKELYYMGIIPVDSLIDLSDNSMIIDYYLKGYIKPKDIKRLYNENKISKDVMKEAVTNPNISFTKKLVFIYSIFQADEDEIIRDELLNSIPNKDEEMYIPQNDIVRQYQEEKMAKQNGNSSNLCKRWNILSNFDDNYSQKLFDDGHIEFFIPKINLYIVEKLYDSNNRTAYGAATYAINKEIYEANIDSIIKNNKINRSNLVKLHKDKEAFKLIHLESWGNQMNDFLNTFKK